MTYLNSKGQRGRRRSRGETPPTLDDRVDMSHTSKDALRKTGRYTEEELSKMFDPPK